MASLRTTGEALANSLEAGVIGPAEVVAWADRQISQSRKPPIEIIEVSLVSDAKQLASLLRVLPGKLDRRESDKLLLRRMHDALQVDPSLAFPLSRKLRDMALDGQALSENDAYVIGLHEDIACAADGLFGDPDGLRDEFLLFLSREAEAP